MHVHDPRRTPVPGKLGDEDAAVDGSAALEAEAFNLEGLLKIGKYTPLELAETKLED